MNSAADEQPQGADYLDDLRLRVQFAQLERHVARGGRDSIDHPQKDGFHDDLANAAAGALVEVAGKMDALTVWARL